MKIPLIALLFSVTTLVASSQTGDPAGRLFEKYSGQEGFTTVYISGKMLGAMAKMDENKTNVFSGLKTIRILSLEDSTLNKKVDFFAELRKMTDFSGYQELMRVSEKNENSIILVRSENERIHELLVLTSGSGGNSMISITGDLDLKALSSLSSELGVGELKNLDRLEKERKK